jgi:NADH-quinone oxidoreductase subunit L
MHHEQDMRHYGALRQRIPMTFWAMLIGTLAITGVGIPLTHIGFAGFLSKDIIIESTFAGHNAAAQFAFGALVLSAAMTSFYSWRLIFMTFHGQTRADHHTFEHAHESPNVMMIPLYVLAAGAVLAGMIWYGDFVGHHEGEWWAGAIFNGPENHVLHDAHDVPKWVKVSPFVAMIIGLAIAWYMYVLRPETPAELARRHQPLYQFLLNKWYFDEVYDFLFVRPAMWVGRTLWKRGDGNTIDGFLNGVAMGIVPWLTRFAGRIQSGYLFHYAFVMLIGVSLIITWFAVGGGH